MVLRNKSSKNNPYKNRRFIDSFRYAFVGVSTVFKEERNMRFHVFSTVMVIIVSYLLSLSLQEWLWMLLVSFLVLVMEIWNTVIENTIDLVTPDYHPLAKKAKDMAAAAVLFTSIFALIVGALILLPKMIKLFL